MNKICRAVFKCLLLERCGTMMGPTTSVVQANNGPRSKPLTHRKVSRYELLRQLARAGVTLSGTNERIRRSSTHGGSYLVTPNLAACSASANTGHRSSHPVAKILHLMDLHDNNTLAYPKSGNYGRVSATIESYHSHRVIGYQLNCTSALSSGASIGPEGPQVQFDATRVAPGRVGWS